MSYTATKKPQSTGLPPWVMTFADLMSLLMCFFVLLLSFSEMDVAKYKQIAGSMREAFGVQREVNVKEAPRGVNIIAQEFSAGRPNPTPLNVIQQQTADELKQFLDTGGRQPQPGEEGRPPDGARRAGVDGQRTATQAQDGTAPDGAPDDQLVMLPREDAVRALRARAEETRQQRLEQTAGRIRAALDTEIRGGAVDVETEQQKIVIRIRERASFPSGAAELREDFRPILNRVGEILKETEGRIIVSGHTDDVPIATRRFRSNWELSAGRAVSVVHDLIDVSRIPSERFAIEGLAETRPVAANDTAENRARNRRVEIRLLQGEDLVAAGMLGARPGAEQQQPQTDPARAGD
ncbi:MAG: type VI secretion system protein TssL, long form [Gammaproteobacteria bacterium]